MELGENDPPPRFLVRRTAVRGAPHCFPGLQGAFRRAHPGLDVRMRGVGAAVVFEIELPLVNRKFAAEAVEPTEERLDISPLRARQTGQIRHAPRPFAHFLGRSTAAVAKAGRGNDFMMDVTLRVHALNGSHFGGFGRQTITAGLADMREHFAPVMPAPEEAAVRKTRQRAPGKLLRIKIVHVRLAHDLRQTGRVSKNIRQP